MESHTFDIQIIKNSILEAKKEKERGLAELFCLYKNLKDELKHQFDKSFSDIIDSEKKHFEKLNEISNFILKQNRLSRRSARKHNSYHNFDVVIPRLRITVEKRATWNTLELVKIVASEPCIQTPEYSCSKPEHQNENTQPPIKQPFSNFKRTNAEGNVVMAGAPNIISEVRPGIYSLHELVILRHIPPITPKHAVIKGVEWFDTRNPGENGRIIFPATFNTEIPHEIATNQTLDYYGASLATDNNRAVSLVYGHVIQDFTYFDNYLKEFVMADSGLGGAGLEKHNFAHIICPLEDDSGTYVIAKWAAPGELHITGFKIPTKHAVYVPGGVMHTNDYLRGTWRTMLSDEGKPDVVQLQKQQTRVGAKKYKSFSFQFT